MSSNAGSFLDRLFSVDGKVVIVTGASRGIGHAIAEGFVRAGARVYICSRSAEDSKSVADQLSEFGVIEAIQADLSSVDGCVRFADAVKARESRVDVLINNAGGTWAEELDTYPEAEWDAVMNVNLKSAFYLTQQVLPLLVAAASPESPARIINVGSIRGYIVPNRPSFAYTASKGALHQLTRHLAAQLAPKSITANVLAPGVYESKMKQTVANPTQDSSTATIIPLKRLAAADDICGVAIFLASRASSYLTGSVIPVDGGVGVATN
ncbi:SDR family oxidoreductase [Rhodococcus opacus]|uniref:SDR family oxidoreductase n=1 Tax=Rhodococcus opacus TaxID=37919 RepID=UPI001469BB64|nr:SDR family oxidoreductase [Rhodococcus opacus]MDV7090805.1 SDR family oxidoreductase [Rhodococcus opacus]WKN60202.1 SDR family oxidoreductase [Rhodococcus opacus]